jgi:DinB family protein
MSQNQLLVESLKGNIGMLKMTVADMTDDELRQRPVPAANNGLWQLGHLIASEAWMVNNCAGKTVIELPAGFAEKYSKETSKVDDPAKLGTKADLMALLEKTRDQTAAWAATLTPADFTKPAPEKMRKMCPTLGHVMNVFPSHIAMHVGQLQVLRRKLGKPILF